VKGIIEWFARNAVAANLLMALIVIAGLTTLPTITQKPFPDLEMEIITVTAEYLGAGPEEVELGVCIRIEEEVDGVEGVDRITSMAVEGICVVTIELLTGSDVPRALDEIKNRVDTIDTFPEEVEKPIVSRVLNQRPVIDVAVSGDVSERTLRELGQRVRDEIARLDGISQVRLTLARPYEIAIEVSESSLRRHGLTFDQVAGAIRGSSMDLPGGSIDTEAGEILLRTKGQAYWGPEFERIVVLTHRNGTRLLLEDIADVRDGFAETDQAARFDGMPAVMVRVFRIGDEDVIHISDSVKEYVAEASVRMPQGVELTVWRDGSRDLRDRRDIMLRNGRAGFMLVLLVLALFVRPRVAFWVALGVPISFAGAFALLPVLGISIDIISLFAFILVLGILVDDAIVIGENVYTHQQRGEDRLEASITGTQEVSVPVIFGVLTTVAAFGPMLAVEGLMGKVFSVLATVVICCLAFSLIEAQLVLPAHLGHGSPDKPLEEQNWFSRSWNGNQERFAAGVERFTATRFRRGLELAGEWRYLTVAIAIAFWLVAVAVAGNMRFSFFPPLEADYVTARLTMPSGTAVADTRAAVRQIEAAIPLLRAELDAEYARPGESLFVHSLTAIGEHPFRQSQDGPPGPGGRVSLANGHLGEVTLELIPSEQRGISTGQIAQRWRELAGPIAGAEELLYASSLFSAGQEIHIQLEGPDIEQLSEAADRIKTYLAGIPGVIDIADSFRAGKREVKLAIRPEAEALGLSLQDLARQVRQGFYGEEVQRIQRGRDDVRVMLRYPNSARRSLGDLENMRIRTPQGGEVPFHAVSRTDVGRGYSTIRRSNRQRIVDVTADVDRTVVTGNEVLAQLQASALPAILSDYAGMTYGLEGIQQEQRKAFGGLIRWYPVALFAIFALLAIPLRSYSQPLLIMSAIPFGLVGAICGHVIMGIDLSFMSVEGMIALTGVVVNASLVLVHCINGLRSEGVPLAQAVADAGVKRFRPILLTSLTTFAGLTPLLLESSVQAQFIVPMATSLAFGVLFSSAITLFLVPSSYLILEDLRSLPERLRTRMSATESMPASEPVSETAPGWEREAVRSSKLRDVRRSEQREA
jgi:multidrug efflux pump subunit AcrB